MYRVSVRDHIMIAHSFRGDVFGPAQALHGATYVVDVIFASPELDEDGIVVDIGRASDQVKEVLADLNYRNLDDVQALAGQNTSTEVMARVVADRVAARALAGELGPGARSLVEIEVRLHESHIAWASYTRTL